MLAKWKEEVGLPKYLDWFIILVFSSAICYDIFQIFWVLNPEGNIGPLFGQAKEIPMQLMVSRRLYANEGWTIANGLIVYMALTRGILPRMKNND